MVSLREDSAWKLILLVLVLVCFAFVGIANVINPDRFMKRSGVMLTEWNRFDLRMVAAVLAGFSVYGLYVVLRDVITK
jgi:hypothetical protein